MFLICSYFLRYLSLNVLISMVLIQQIACITVVVVVVFLSAQSSSFSPISLPHLLLPPPYLLFIYKDLFASDFSRVVSIL